MTNKIQIFNDDCFGEVRILKIKGRIYAVGSDVAKALGYRIPHKAVNTHCKGVLKWNILTGGGNQEVLIIPEGDIYRLIIRSKLPAAEQFEKWIFDEVLPAIRREGSYINRNNEVPRGDDNIRADVRGTEKIQNKMEYIKKCMIAIEIFLDAYNRSNSRVPDQEKMKQAAIALGYRVFIQMAELTKIPYRTYEVTDQMLKKVLRV